MTKPSNPDVAPSAKRWKRRLIRASIIALCAVLVFRLALVILLPVAIARVARGFGFDCEYQRLKLSLMGTNASLWGVVIKSSDGKHEILRTDYASANLSTLQLLRLRLVAWRVEADDVRVDVVRTPDGAIPLLEQLAAATATSASPKGSARAPEFTSPLQIQALRLHRLALHIRDETVSPAFEDIVRLNLRVSNFGRAGVPVAIDVGATASGLFSSASAEGAVTFGRSSVEADIDFAIRGMRADRAGGYLKQQGLAADARGLDAKGKGTLSLKASSDVPGAMEGNARFSDLLLSAGSDSVARLSLLNVDITTLSPSEVRIADVRVDGGTLQAHRTEQGRIRFASLLTLGDTLATPSPSEPVTRTTAPAAPAGSRFKWRVDRLYATGLAASLEDEAITPHANLQVLVSEFKVTDLSNYGVPESGPVFMARLTAPRAVEAISFDGRALPFAPQPSATGVIELQGIRPDVLAPYLAMMGMESTLESASVRCQIDGTWAGATPGRGALVMSKVTLQDRGDALIEAGPVTVSGLGMSESGELVIESLEGAGPVLNIQRRTDGSFEVVGVRIGSTTAEQSRGSLVVTPKPESPGPRQPLRFSLPPARIGRLAWGGVKVHFEDLSQTANSDFALTDAGFELKDLVIGPDTGRSKPGSIHAWANIPGAINNLEAIGQISATTSSARVEGSLECKGMTIGRLAAYLTPLGIEPTLRNGDFAAKWAAGISSTDRGIMLDASAADVSLSHEGRLLAGVARAGLDGLSIEPGRLVGGTVQVDRAKLIASRDKEGAIHIAGIRLHPRPAKEPADTPLPDPLALIDSLGDVAVKGVAIKDLELNWSDQAARAPVESTVIVNATLGPLHLNSPDAEPAPFAVRVSATNVADEFKAEGSLAVGGQATQLQAKVMGQGITTRTIATYLPEGTSGELQKGRLQLDVSAEVSRVKPGSLGVAIDVRSLEYREDGAVAPLAQVGEFVVDIASFDTTTCDTHIRRIASTGVQAAAARRADGALAALGFALAPTRPRETPLVATIPPPPTGAPSVTSVVEATKRPQPRISVESIDIQADALVFTDDARPGSAPVTLAGLGVRSVAPFVLLGPDARQNPAAKIAIAGRVEPVISEFGIQIETSPFAERPSFSMNIGAAGISGSGITQVVPELGEFIDGTPLKDGRFKMSIAGDAKVQRRGEWIDLNRAAVLEVSVDGVEFRSGEAGPVLVGVGKVRAEQVKVEPGTGNIIARNVEVENISGNAWRDESGVNILGMNIRMPAASEGATPEPNQAVPVEPAPATKSEDAPARSAVQGGAEVRIDRLAATGIDFRFEDRAVTPSLTIPINALDAEVRGLSSLMLERERPIRLNASVGAGKVTLPRPARGGTVTNVSVEADANADLKPEEPTQVVEEREFFSQCMASGTVVFYPKPRGRVSASINGVELAALRGIANEAGASVGGGVFDGRVDLRARDDGAFEARTRLIVTDLKYAEPPSGPVERYMALPVPIDLAIAAVEAPDGSITLPVDVTLTEQGLTMRKLIGAIALAAGQVVATAVASAPVKVVAGFGGLFGGDDDQKEWVEDTPVALGYTAGVTVLGQDELRQLDDILARARADSRVQVVIEHEIGREDARVLLRRANPTREEASSLAEDLRLRRTELIARRADLLRPATASALGVGTDEAALKRFRALQEELADVEDSMDRLYELLGAAAQGIEIRRARAQAVDLIDARMAAVRDRVQRVAGARGSPRIGIVRGRPEVGASEASRLVVRIRQRKG